MQHVSLLMEVAGLEEKWVEVKGHTVEVLQSIRTALGEALSSNESQGLHVSRFYRTNRSVSVPVGDESCRLTALGFAALLISSVAVCLGAVHVSRPRLAVLGHGGRVVGGY